MPNAPLLRRLGAMLYDGLLVIALMFMTSMPFIALRGGEPVEAGDPAYRIAMLATAWIFFTFFWTRSGRTLGMQSWRIQLELPEGGPPGFGRASLRFFAAILSWIPLGLGFWWQLWDRDDLSWHDRLSGTRIRYYPKDGTDDANALG